MSSKLLVGGSCSTLEAIFGGIELTDSILGATFYVNPPWNNLVGKVIIINLPLKLDFDRLGRYNKLISRFPLKSKGKRPVKYELRPYPEVKFNLNTNPEEYKDLILNKYLLTDPNVSISESDRFLLGTEPETEGELNLIGYLLIKTIKS